MPVLLYEMQAQHHHGYRSGMRVEKGRYEMNDVVNHPSHYETGKFECFDVMMEALGVENVKGFCYAMLLSIFTGRKGKTVRKILKRHNGILTNT